MAFILGQYVIPQLTIPHLMLPFGILQRVQPGTVVYQVGDLVEVQYILSNGAWWRAEVVAVREKGLELKLLEGPLGRIAYVEFEGATINILPRAAKCGTCKRDADVGLPCWWCGTKVT